jgi:2-polyprenyl-6-methoxyphenol hydroxylase-like FAD-dependent oxidoreductase
MKFIKRLWIPLAVVALQILGNVILGWMCKLNVWSADLFAANFFAAGIFSVGVFSLGIVSVGVFSIGIFSIGIVPLGVFSVGFAAAIGFYRITLLGKMMKPTTTSPSASMPVSNPEASALDGQQSPASAAEVVKDTKQTTCCIVGGGPAGVVLGLLLARANIPVVLLEAHKDFERDFRGDTLHASVMEIMDQLGLAERLLELAHGRVHKVIVQTALGPYTLQDFGRLRTRFPFATLMPQSRFLDFLVGEAKNYPQFQLLMNANVQRLVEEGGVVRGVRYRGEDGDWHEVRATLTVGADGRFSKVRSLAGMELINNAPEIDVLWIRLPRKPGDPEEAGGGVNKGGRVLVIKKRPEYWQLGMIVAKGSYQQFKAAGLDALRKIIVDMVPWFADRIDYLQDWRQVMPLLVQSGRLEKWYKPGLLMIGDAAHVMSPVCSVGVNYAIQDAVETVNVLKKPLQEGRVEVQNLADVQRRRNWPTKIIQRFQGIAQGRLFAAMDPAVAAKPWKPALGLRIMLSLPFLRTLPGRLIHFGLWKVRLEE